MIGCILYSQYWGSSITGLHIVTRFDLYIIPLGGVSPYLAESYFAESYFAESYLAESYLAESHFAESYLTESYLAKSRAL